MTVTKKPWQAAGAGQVPVWLPEIPETTNQFVVTHAVMLDGYVDFMPYTVPAGWNLELVNAHFVDKHVEYGGNSRNSYMHLWVIDKGLSVMITTTSAEGNMPLGPAPYIIRSGGTIVWVFANNGPEVENMSGILTGFLRKAT